VLASAQPAPSIRTTPIRESPIPIQPKFIPL
jgi:hypothetical protein